MSVVFYNDTMFMGTHEDMADLVWDLVELDPDATIEYEWIS